MNVRTFPSLFVVAFAISHSTLVWGQAIESGNDIYFDPIIVTGELIDRPLEETGTSAVVLDEEDLEERAGLDSVRDVLEQTPNVSVLTGTIQAPTIRGVDGTGPAIGGNAFFAGTRPRLIWQTDGRPASYNEVIYGDLNIWDLERIEILRGPQSTLVGRNSIAGTVVIETKDPTFEPEATAQLAGGNLDQRRFSGVINAPFANDLAAVRLSADWLSSTSPVDYEPFPDVDDPSEKEALNVRGKLLVQPDIGVDTEILLSLTHNKTKSPQGETVVRPFEDRVSDFPQQPVHT